jgi:alpha-L-arabinofuranosidase
LNAFIRHAASVRMANLAQLVNVLAPIWVHFTLGAVRPPVAITAENRRLRQRRG